MTYNQKMSESFEAVQTTDPILDFHRRGIADRMRTVDVLSTLIKRTDADRRSKIFEYLAHILRTESFESRSVRGESVNVPMVALMVLARLGPTALLPKAVVARIRLENVREMDIWAREVAPTLQFCLSENRRRFPESVLLEFKAYIATYQRAVPPCTVFLDALASLETVLDRLDLERFEDSLTQSPEIEEEDGKHPASIPTCNVSAHILEALNEAQEHLRGERQFDAKKAADLLRSSMDETHRALVQQLEALTAKKYQGGERDDMRRHYLRDVGFLSPPEEKFLSVVYGLISAEASHKLMAPRETVLVMYTTVNGFIHLLFKRLSFVLVGDEQRAKK